MSAHPQLAPQHTRYHKDRPIAVSIAICTWNRAESLDRTLTSMANLRLPAGQHWELLIVNNNCTDFTDDVIERHSQRLPIRRLFEATPGVVSARNRALSEAQGEFLLWTDDDVEVTPDWIEKYLEAFDSFEADVVFGTVEPLWETAPPDWYISECHGLFALLDLGGPPRLIQDHTLVGFNVNLGVRRSALSHLGEYRVDGSGRTGGGEDVDLFRRAYAANLRVVYQPHARIRHIIPASRCEKAFHRRSAWKGSPYHFGLLRKEAILENLPTILGIPRYFYRYNLEYLANYLKALTIKDHSKAFFYELKLIRMLALLWLAISARWGRQSQSEVGEAST